jgi:hypothetical protein
MNAKCIFGLLSVALALGACKKELEPQPASGNPTTPTTAQTPVQNAPVAQMTAPPQGQNVSVAPAAPAPTGQVAAGMNPPHGQPNHRCDIAVGAPLNSPPGKTAAKPTMTIDPNQGKNQAFKITPNASGMPPLLQPNAAVATAPGMNPPHGQPNHRCDIAVGAPLNSPPGNTAAAAVKTDPVKADPNKTEITVSDPVKAEPKKSE